MNNFEFWNDMDKIFDAIVAYQEKTIEFNKRFINPWVNLGNVFDKKEDNEAVATHKNAIEIDPKNAQNWYELAGIYTRSGDFDESIQAYQKAIELGFESGDLYKNMGLAYVMTARHKQAIPVFEKALELLESEKEKAVIWNHIGNVYRRLNDYQMALQAFQNADRLESVQSSQPDEQITVDTGEEISVLSSTDEDKDIPASQMTDEPALVADNDDTPEMTTVSTEESDLEIVQEADQEEEDVGNAETASASDEVVLPGEAEQETQQEDGKEDEYVNDSSDDMPVVIEIDFTQKLSGEHLEEVGPKAVDSDSFEPVQEEVNEESVNEESVITEALQVQSEFDEEVSKPEKDETPVQIENGQDEIDTDEASVEDEVVSNFEPATDDGEIQIRIVPDQESEETLLEEQPIEESLPVVEEDSTTNMTALDEKDDDNEDSGELSQIGQNTAMALTDEDPVEDKTVEENLETNLAEEVAEPTLEDVNNSTNSAYEQYLQDNNSPMTSSLPETHSDEESSKVVESHEARETNLEMNVEEADTDSAIDVDTKNAHVWNELGNVYFNSGSLDDAIAAYSKAIELDKQFAWAYTNLAMAFVQKERLEEAILLYQRSIELFSSEKDKAVSWNRLGDLYRHLDDYENAIAAYQRADELEPGNTSITNQAKFSLLGSAKVDQGVSYSL